MNKFFSWVFILWIFLPFSKPWAAVSSPWVDAMASKLLSRLLRVTLDCHKIKVMSGPTVHFDSMTVGRGPQKRWAGTGPGQFRFSGLPFNKTSLTGVRLSDVVLPKDFEQQIPWASSLFKRLDPEALTINSLDMSLVKRTEYASVHVTRCLSKEFIVKGGAKIEKGRLVKAHAVILLPANVWERFPGLVTSRMIKRPGDWRGFRVIYRAQDVTVLGAESPFLKAQWK